MGPGRIYASYPSLFSGGQACSNFLASTVNGSSTLRYFHISLADAGSLILHGAPAAKGVLSRRRVGCQGGGDKGPGAGYLDVHGQGFLRYSCPSNLALCRLPHMRRAVRPVTSRYETPRTSKRSAG